MPCRILGVVAVLTTLCSPDPAPNRNKSQVKGTRFTHAAEFAQERSVPAQDVSALGPMPTSAARTAAGAAAGGGAAAGAGAAQAESPAARQRGETDQTVKEEELEQLRNELEEVTAQTVEVNATQPQSLYSIRRERHCSFAVAA